MYRGFSSIWFVGGCKDEAGSVIKEHGSSLCNSGLIYRFFLSPFPRGDCWLGFMCRHFFALKNVVKLDIFLTKSWEFS